MRKLVTLRRIAAINPIPGADAIEVATVDGWNVVVKKGEFSRGQEVLYFEIDSVLPAGRPEFEFLMARSRKINPVVDAEDVPDVLDGHRLRTIKLRGQVSQGLILPLLINEILSEDDDLSSLFGVKKYEKQIPAHLAGLCRGNYPGWLPKTDQERVQNCHRNIPPGMYAVEEKIEGSSMTIYHDGESIGVTSRNVDLKLDQEGNAYVDTAFKSDLFTALDHYVEKYATTGIAIRGELIGPGIQGNIYNLNATRFHIYDIWLDGRYLTPEERETFIFDHIAGIANHEVAQCARTLSMCDPTFELVTDLVAMANGQSELYPTRREGLVFKSEFLHNGNVFSFKAISPLYLLREAS